jgi:hypothetical protein
MSNADTALVRGTVMGMTYDEAERASKAIAASGHFKDAEKVSQALVKVLKGQELGIGPVTAVQEIVIVKGKLSMSASLVAALIKRSGKYDYVITEHTDQACAMDFFQDGKRVGNSRFTMDDARRAGLLVQGGMYEKYPRNMLFSRTLTNGARWYCAELFVGGVYTPDELGAGMADEIVAVASVAAAGRPIERPAPARAEQPIEAEYREVAEPEPQPAKPVAPFDPAKVKPWFLAELGKPAQPDGSTVVDRAAANHLHNTFTRLCGVADAALLVRGYLTGNPLGSWQQTTNHEARAFWKLAQHPRAAEQMPVLVEYVREQASASQQEIARKKAADAEKPGSEENSRDVPEWSATEWQGQVYATFLQMADLGGAHLEQADADLLARTRSAFEVSTFAAEQALDLARYLLCDASAGWEDLNEAQAVALSEMLTYRGYVQLLDSMAQTASAWVAKAADAEVVAP